MTPRRENQNVNELLTPADAARIVGDLTPAGIKAAARGGRLSVAARTPRGMHLFRRDDVLAFRASRADRNAA